MVDFPSGQLQTTGLQMLDVDLPIDEIALFIDDVKDAVTKLRSGNEAGIYNTSAELLKAGGEVTICGLPAVLATIWHSSTILPYWNKGLAVPI